MRVGGRGAWVLVVAATLGVVGGLTTALLAPDPVRSGNPQAGQDPLGLGVDRQDLGCTGQSILVVGFGDTSAALSGSIADNRDEGVHYLNTAASCSTVYGYEDRDQPAYAAYLGPYADVTSPCTTRFAGEHRGGFVTRLRAANSIHVKCACVLPVEALPVLKQGIDVTANAVYVRALQGLLHDRDPELFSREQITGVYDEPTAARIRALQAAAPITVTGEVGGPTWRFVRARSCRDYDF